MKRQEKGSLPETTTISLSFISSQVKVTLSRRSTLVVSESCSYLRTTVNVDQECEDDLESEDQGWKEKRELSFFDMPLLKRSSLFHLCSLLSNERCLLFRKTSDKKWNRSNDDEHESTQLEAWRIKVRYKRRNWKEGGKTWGNTTDSVPRLVMKMCSSI